MTEKHIRLDETNTSWCGKEGILVEDPSDATCSECLRKVVEDWGYEAVYCTPNPPKKPINTRQ